MFTTVEQVKALTGYDVTLDKVNQAQAVLESFMGRVEADIDDPNDKAVLARATAFQAAYMNTNADRVYEQIAVRSVAQSDGGAVMNTDMWAPFIAPLAILSMRSLSWKRNRSVKTGPVFEGSSRIGWEYN